MSFSARPEVGGGKNSSESMLIFGMIAAGGRIEDEMKVIPPNAAEGLSIRSTPPHRGGKNHGESMLVCNLLSKLTALFDLG